MKKLLTLASVILVCVNAHAKRVKTDPLTEYVTCNIGLQIFYKGKPNHLNINNIKGKLLDDDSDYWTVDFSKTLPKEYSYSEGPILKVNGNDCLYVNPPKEYTK